MSLDCNGQVVQSVQLLFMFPYGAVALAQWAGNLLIQETLTQALPRAYKTKLHVLKYFFPSLLYNF